MSDTWPKLSRRVPSRSVAMSFIFCRLQEGSLSPVIVKGSLLHSLEARNLLELAGQETLEESAGILA